MKILETLLTVPLRLPVIDSFAAKAYLSLRRAMAGAMRRRYKDKLRPREWSNRELRRVGGMFSGRVVNVSGWKDEDKEGGHYRDYFPNASDYVVSNFSGSRGVADGHRELFLDLEGEIPGELQASYSAAFNHTTLEHIYDIRKAVQNICSLSHDAVILVTPFLQAVHFEEGAFGDYWRPTPMCLNRMLEESGFSVVYQSSNDNPWYIVYVFTVAVRNPDAYKGRLPARQSGGDRVGLFHFGME